MQRAQLDKPNLEENMKEASPRIGIVFSYRLHMEENEVINYPNLKGINSMSIQTKSKAY